MSLRIVPLPSHPQSTQASFGAPSAPGVHDTLRANLSLSAPAPKDISSSSQSTTHSDLQSTHPLESRLSKWRVQQETLKMEMLRRNYGIAEPVKRQMELQIVRAGEWMPLCMGLGGGASLHADILSGRDTEIGWEDVYAGDEMRDLPDFHTEMERRMHMNW